MPLTRTARPAAQHADERVFGCGWFDSSLDLQDGLRVTEHEGQDALRDLVPAGWWLAWELDAVLHAPRLVR